MASSVEIPRRPQAPIEVGISQCLTGAAVRYDGSGARVECPHAELDGLFNYHTFCPEVGIGMPVPRPPIRLLGDTASYRLVAVHDSSVDKTDEIEAFGRAQVASIANLAGYIFMHNSPSCGLNGVKLYAHESVRARRRATGIFARTVTASLTELPVADANRLFDARLRENFVMRTFIYAHWQNIAEDLNTPHLRAFHSRYDFLLMAHSPAANQAIERLLHDSNTDIENQASSYIRLLMDGLQQPTTRKSHANVMSHLQESLKKHLDSTDLQNLGETINAYQRGEQPLHAPLALLKQHLRTVPTLYDLARTYLKPIPHPQATL